MVRQIPCERVSAVREAGARREQLSGHVHNPVSCSFFAVSFRSFSLAVSVRPFGSPFRFALSVRPFDSPYRFIVACLKGETKRRTNKANQQGEPEQRNETAR